MMSRPNIVVFFTDQQRWDSTGVHGNPLGLTPNFDRVAKRGTHCFNAYTCQPVCGPARAALQTGLYATTAGVPTNGGTIDEGCRTLPEYFSDAGYHTGYIGKWHLAKGVQAVAPEYRKGYQYWLGARSSRQGCDPAGAGRRKPTQVLSCQLSGFGHVAMPQLVFGNGTSTARCIRPYGRKEPGGQNSQGVEQVWEPEDKRMVAASRT